jgi:Short C-terminal domain
MGSNSGLPRPDEDKHSSEESMPEAPDIQPYEFRPGPPFILSKFQWKYSLGWQERPERKGGSGFVVVQRGYITPIKVLERFPLTPDGWASAWRALVKLDPASAQHVLERLNERAAVQRASGQPSADLAWLRQRQREGDQKRSQQVERVNEARSRYKSAIHLRALGVAICGGEVYREEPFGLHNRLGPLAGAHAEVTGGQSGRRRSGAVRALDAATAAAVIGPAGLAAGASRKAVRGTAFVIFADSTVHEAAMADQATLVRAQADAIRFNALAAASSQTPTETVTDPAVRLRKLQELRDAGLLTREEYETKRAEVIDSI